MSFFLRNEYRHQVNIVFGLRINILTSQMRKKKTLPYSSISATPFLLTVAHLSRAPQTNAFIVSALESRAVHADLAAAFATEPRRRRLTARRAAPFFTSLSSACVVGVPLPMGSERGSGKMLHTVLPWLAGPLWAGRHVSVWNRRTCAHLRWSRGVSPRSVLSRPATLQDTVAPRQKTRSCPSRMRRIRLRR